MLRQRGSRSVRIKPTFSVIVHDDNTVELRAGVWNPRSFTLTDYTGAGKLATLVRGLDGSMERGALAKQVGITRAELEALLDHLDQLDVLEQGPSTALDALLEQTGRSTIERPAMDTVRVVGDRAAVGVAGLLGAHPELTVIGPEQHRALLDEIDECPLDILEDALASERFVERFEPWRGALLVHVTETVHPLRLAVLNRVMLALGTPWLQASVDGPLVLVGPTFLPMSTACFACFETRVVMNLREAANYQRYKDAIARDDRTAGITGSCCAEVVTAMMVGHTALEALNMATTGTTATVGKVLGIYLPAMELAYSEVLRLPGCSSCGSVPERDGTELYFDMRRWVDA